MKVQQWFVYMVRCSDSSLYTGITTDLNRRLMQHNSGKGSKYTRSRLPAILEYYESFKSRADSCVRELQIKSLTKLQKEELILNSN